MKYLIILILIFNVLIADKEIKSLKNINIDKEFKKSFPKLYKQLEHNKKKVKKSIKDNNRKKN